MYRTVGYGMSGLALLDIVGGVIFLLPLIGLATPGSSTLDEDSIHFTLTYEEVEKIKEVEKVKEIEEVAKVEEVENV